MLIQVGRTCLVKPSKYFLNLQFRQQSDHELRRRFHSTNLTDILDVSRLKESHNLKNIPDSEIRKSVFTSQSSDIFTNLALEEWMFQKFDFSRHHVLLLWSNDPCVVIGRHQNPFKEVNVSKLHEKGIALARRNSGGGTVYNDKGNLNCTFFTPKHRYNRDYNLNIIRRALHREWNIHSVINDKYDIVIGDYKISGSAAKIGHPNAYHHCTLLVNSNKDQMKDALLHEHAKYVSKATFSVRSPLQNLCDVCKDVSCASLLSAVGYEFLRTTASELSDGGRDLILKQRGFKRVNPTEKWFPGITEIRNLYSSWDWCIGKTPNFHVNKDILLKADEKEQKITLRVDVEKGLMSNIHITMPTNEVLPVIARFQDKSYNEESLHGIINAIQLVSTDNANKSKDEE